MRCLALAAALFAAPASAGVVASSDAGFSTSSTATVAVDATRVWAALVKPAGWWSKDHTFSGAATNLSLDPKVGGCFCESLPGKPAGGVRHMTVIYAKPGETLRLSGALGPLQSEPLNGVLTVELKPAANGGTAVTFTYVVGGYSRLSLKDIAPVVDRVLGEQLTRLAAALKAP